MINSNPFLIKYPQVFPDTTQWSELEYKLQLSLGSTSAVLKKIWNVSSPQLFSNFQRQHKNGLIIDCMSDITKLDSINNLQKICKKGFDIPDGGILFSQGYIKINQVKQKTYEFLICKVSVGKSYCLPKKNYHDKVKLPNGFNSIYLYQDEYLDVFKHQYVIFNSIQILPCFVVHFQFDPKIQNSFKTPLCEVCGDNLAKFYCLIQNASFCLDCDYQNHKNKLTVKHTRIDILQKPKEFSICPFHAGMKQQLYCTECHQALCVNCKINGSHMLGQLSNHQLTRIADVYQSISQKSNQIDPYLQKRKNQLSQLLSNIDLKIKQVNKNATMVQQQIYILLQNSLKQLQQNAQKKMSYLIGDQLQLKRQYDYIQWMESFLKYQQKILLPSDFLIAWTRHSKLRKQVLNLQNIPLLTDVKADLKIQGMIKILTSNSKNNNPYNFNEKFNLDKITTANKQNISTPIKKDKESGLKNEQAIGSTAFRRNIFNKHLDKNANLLKAGMSSNIKSSTPLMDSPVKKNNLKLSILKDEFPR